MVKRVSRFQGFRVRGLQGRGEIEMKEGRAKKFHYLSSKKNTVFKNKCFAIWLSNIGEA
jgi:hypothetical protein